MLRDLVAAYEAHLRAAAETEEAIARRAGIPRESLSRALRKARTGQGDIETATAVKIAAALGLRWQLAPAAP